MVRDSTYKQSPWEYPLGARVVITGLNKAPDMNGRTGVVKSFLKNCLKSLHTNSNTVKFLNGRQVIELDCLTDVGSPHPDKKNLLVRPSNLHYEPRRLDTLNMDELISILEYKKVKLPASAKGQDRKEKSLLQDAVMQDCLLPIIVQYGLNEDETAIEIGGLLAEAGGTEKPKQMYHEKRAQHEGGKATFTINMAGKTVSIPEDRDGDPPLEQLGRLDYLVEGMTITAANHTNRVPQDTIFARLARPRKPPQLVMGNDSALLLVPSQIGKRILKKLCSGPLTFTFHEDIDQENFQIVVWKEEYEGQLPLDEFITTGTMLFAFQFFQSYHPRIGAYRPQMYWIPNMQGEITNRTLLYQLHHHIMHRFFRALASHLSSKFRTYLYDCLKETYQTEVKWKHAVDLSIAMADSRFKCNDSNTAIGLVDVGEALEAAGDHGKAAFIYKDLAKLFDQNRLTNENQFVTSLMAHGYAGTAFLRAKKWGAALDEYLIALKVDISCHECWDVNYQDEKYQIGRGCGSHYLLSKVYLNYRAIIDDVEKHKKIQLALLALVCLLNAAGFVPDNPFGTDHTFERMKSQKQFLHPRYVSSPTAATNALAQAIMNSSSGLDFHDILIGHLHLDGTQMRFHFEGEKIKAMSSKRQAQLDIVNNYHNGKTIGGGVNCCDYPACNYHHGACPGVGINFRDCECGSVAYCSTECQHAHWKEHKKLHKRFMAAKGKK